MNNNIKLLGQVFTPENIVIDMLNLVDYKGKKILKNPKKLQKPIDILILYVKMRL